MQKKVTARVRVLCLVLVVLLLASTCAAAFGSCGVRDVEVNDLEVNHQVVDDNAVSLIEDSDAI